MFMEDSSLPFSNLEYKFKNEKKKLTFESCFLSLEKEKSQMLEDWQGICTISKSKVKNKNFMLPSRLTIIISGF